MTFVSGAITVILGLLLGLALVSTGKRGQFRNPDPVLGALPDR